MDFVELQMGDPRVAISTPVVTVLFTQFRADALDITPDFVIQQLLLIAPAGRCHPGTRCRESCDYSQTPNLVKFYLDL